MGMVITESEMSFGDYKKEQVFCIEKSRQYTEKLRGKGIKSCEFLLLRGNKLYFIEAKKSCPKQIAADTEEEKRRKYKRYIQEIVLKMKHSLMLYANIILRRYSMDGVPEALRDLSETDVRLILVVKNAEKEWLAPFQDVFNKEMKDEMLIWNIPSFMVINEETARKKHFIV